MRLDSVDILSVVLGGQSSRESGGLLDSGDGSSTSNGKETCKSISISTAAKRLAMVRTTANRFGLTDD